MKRTAALFLITIFALSLATSSYAQFTMGSKNVAMGQAVTAMPDDRWAPFHNPALMPDHQHASFFGIRYFGLPELTDVAATTSYHSGWGTVGAGMFTYGDERLRESQFRLAYGYEVFNVMLGASANLHHMNITGRFGSALAPSFDFGVAVEVYEGLIFGARATNFTRSTIGADESDLPADLALGLSYQLMERALLVTELYKDVDFDPSFRGGLEVRVLDMLYLRGGLTHDHPETFTFGLGIEQEYWTVNVAVEQHSKFGLSPGIDFSILW